MQKEWENLKNDKNQVVGDVEIYVDLGDIAVSDANTKTKEEKMNEITGDEKGNANIHIPSIFLSCNFLFAYLKDVAFFRRI